MAPKKGSLAGGRELSHVEQKEPMTGSLLRRIIEHSNELQQQIDKLNQGN